VDIMLHDSFSAAFSFYLPKMNITCCTHLKCILHDSSGFLCFQFPVRRNKQMVFVKPTISQNYLSRVDSARDGFVVITDSNISSVMSHNYNDGEIFTHVDAGWTSWRHHFHSQFDVPEWSTTSSSLLLHCKAERCTLNIINCSLSLS